MNSEEAFERKTLEIIKHARILTFDAISRELKLKRGEFRRLGDALERLVMRGELFATAKQEYYLPRPRFELAAKIALSAKGYGFVAWPAGHALHGESSIFVPAQRLNNALHDDLVRVVASGDPHIADKYTGTVIGVEQRAKPTFVVKVSGENGNITVKPLDYRLTAEIKFTEPVAVFANTFVRVKVEKYDRNVLLVAPVAVIGAAEALSIEAYIEDANVPHVFNAEALANAHQIPLAVQANEIANRRDRRDEMIVTIDGDDTKDFDDAISVRRLENGNYLLEVHIADVSYYVPWGSPIDLEARARGTSIYLVDRVVPMLPEALSNGICSLNPQVDRLTLAVEMEIDAQGNTVRYEVYESVIRSHRRLTYNEVNQFLRDGKSLDDAPLMMMLKAANELSDILRRFKDDEGYIDFEIKETKIITRGNNEVVDIVVREHDVAEQLIENFMIRANEVVARHISTLNEPGIYRVHDKPDLESLTMSAKVLELLEVKAFLPSHAEPREFARSIREIKRQRFDDFIKVMMLRTMAKAEYSTKNIGHFGLGSRFYTHFTSPIRRYPDLMVHRILRHNLGKKQIESEFSGSELAAIAASSSAAEIKATDLERQIDSVLIANYYAGMIGQLHVGVITSVLPYGFFVEFPNKAGGLVHISALPPEQRFRLADHRLAFVGDAVTYTIGDTIEVVILSTTSDEGKINLIPARFYSKAN